MTVKEIFISLTAKTTLPGSEGDIFEIIEQFTSLDYDSYGNGYVKIGHSDTVFMSHLDNFCEKSSYVNHVFDNNFIRTDGTSILGADDKAGVSIMLYMISHQIPGLYCFFKAEELGCLGSNAFKVENYQMLDSYKKCISFDRKGYSDIVICQNNINTASTKFATELIEKFAEGGINYNICETGGITDSSIFKYLIPECINISVGYFLQHTFKEHIDIDFLNKLANQCLTIDWQNLSYYREIPSLNQMYLEISAKKLKELEEIRSIEKELGFSLY